MIKRAFFIALIIFFSSLNSFAGDDGAGASIGRTSIFFRAAQGPDFALQSTAGKTVRLSDFKGKIVLLDFWTTWCGWCKKAFPDLIKLQTKYKDDLVVLGISFDDESTKGAVLPTMKKYGINYAVLYGTEKMAEDFGGIEGFPTTLFIDRNGNIADRLVGYQPMENYVEVIEKLK